MSEYTGSLAYRPARISLLWYLGLVASSAAAFTPPLGPGRAEVVARRQKNLPELWITRGGHWFEVSGELRTKVCSRMTASVARTARVARSELRTHFSRHRFGWILHSRPPLICLRARRKKNNNKGHPIQGAGPTHNERRGPGQSGLRRQLVGGHPVGFVTKTTFSFPEEGMLL